MTAINNKNRLGQTPLIEAIINDDRAKFDRLIEAGADVNIIDKYEYGAVYYAIFYRNKYALKVLVEKGINLDYQDHLGQVALMTVLCVAWDEGLEFLDILLSGNPNLNIQDRKGFTAVRHATMYGNVDALLLLIDKGADVTIPDNLGITPLQHAKNMPVDDALISVLEGAEGGE